MEARSKVAGLKVDASTIDDPEKLKKFEAAQNELSGSLSRLLVVAEQYPTLKATDGYRDLQAQLEGTENRITVARKRYIDEVAQYNSVVQKFPTSIGASMRGRGHRRRRRHRRTLPRRASGRPDRSRPGRPDSCP